MAFFKRNKKTLEMTPEIQNLIKLSKRLSEETRIRMKAGGTNNVLSYRLQLRDNLNEMDQLLESIENSGITEKKLAALQNIFIRLKTSSENIMKWKFGEAEDNRY